MADTGTQETRPKPGTKKTAPAAKKTQKKGPALYHLFSKSSKGVLTPVGDLEAKSAELAAGAFVKSPPTGQEEFAEQIREGKAVVVAIPERNYTVVGAEEEVKTTLRIKARK